MTLRNALMVISLALSIAIGWVIARGKPSAAAGAKGSAEASETRPLRIGLSLDTLKEARWVKDRDLFVEAARKLGAEVLVQSANSNDTKQMQDIQGLISRGVDVLVIVPHDGKAMGQAVDLARRNGIPVLSYDRLITNTPSLDLYVTFDNEKVGELQARYLADRLAEKPGSARIVRIYGSPTDNNAKLFKAGQDRVIEPLVKTGRIQVVHQDWAADWRPENAKRITNAAITRNGPKIDGILASNDGTAGGAVQALLEEGLAGAVVVTGQDAELAALQRIVAGTQAMTVYKPVARLATKAAELAVALARGDAIETNETLDNGRIEVPSIYADVAVVDKSNIRETVIKDGFHTYEDIYRSVPGSERPPRTGE